MQSSIGFGTFALYLHRGATHVSALSRLMARQQSDAAQAVARSDCLLNDAAIGRAEAKSIRLSARYA